MGPYRGYCFIVSTKSMQTGDVENRTGAKLRSTMKCQVREFDLDSED